MRDDHIGRGVGLRPQRAMGQQANLLRWRLLQRLVWPASHPILPNRHLALGGERPRHCKGVDLLRRPRALRRQGLRRQP
jgi:hypothetical protein